MLLASACSPQIQHGSSLSRHSLQSVGVSVARAPCHLAKVSNNRFHVTCPASPLPGVFAPEYEQAEHGRCKLPRP